MMFYTFGISKNTHFLTKCVKNVDVVQINVDIDQSNVIIKLWFEKKIKCLKYCPKDFCSYLVVVLTPW